MMHRDPVQLMLALALIGLLAADSFSQDRERRGRGGGFLQRMMEEYDADGDGKLSQDEVPEEMAERFSKETGRQVARSTMGAAVLRLGITRKKRRFAHRSAIQKK